MSNTLSLFAPLFLSYCLAPLSISAIIGIIQRYLFFRDSPKVFRLWPVMTVAGVLATIIGGVALMFILSFIFTVVLSKNSSGSMSVILLFMLFGSAFGGIGIIISLSQACLLSGWKALWHLIGGLISAFVGGLVSVGINYLLWYHTVFDDPVGEESFFLTTQIPIAIIIILFTYGIGTSIMLFTLRKTDLIIRS